MFFIFFLILLFSATLSQIGCEGTNCDNCDSIIEFEIIPDSRGGEDCFYGDVLKEDLVEDETLQNVSCIHGNLYLSSSELTKVQFPNLKIVKGDVRIKRNLILEEISIPRLQQVEGDLSIAHNPLIDDLHFPNLQSIEDFLSIENNPRITEIDFEQLQHIGAGVYFLCNRGMATCEIEKFTSRFKRDSSCFAACYHHNQRDTCSFDKSGCPEDLNRQCEYN